MATFLRATLVVCLSGTLGAAPQQPASDLPVSLERIKEALEKTPAPRIKLDVPVERPVATFRSRVDQRVYVLPLKDWIEKEFKLNALQRQSADWAAMCCGIRLDPLFKGVEKALQRRRVRKIREQIARDLAELVAARKK